MKALKLSSLILIILAAAYFLGPQAPKAQLDPSLPELPAGLAELEAEIRNSEAALGDKIRPGNAARIIWADPDSPAITPYSLVYLHGFSASSKEGDPVHEAIARRYGMNLYLARLHSHGLNAEEPLLDFTPEDFLASAARALAIGKRIGEKVILMSTSTGGTVSLYLAAHQPDAVAAQILYSPNVNIYSNSSHLLTKPWGLQIARLIFGSKYREFEASDEAARFTTRRYRIEALVNLRSLVDAAMTAETFQKVSQPMFVGYYYKNETEHDEVVSIEAIQEMYESVPASVPKRIVAFPDVGNHVMAGELWSKDVESVIVETERFLEEVVHIEPVNPIDQRLPELQINP